MMAVAVAAVAAAVGAGDKAVQLGAVFHAHTGVATSQNGFTRGGFFFCAPPAPGLGQRTRSNSNTIFLG